MNTIKKHDIILRTGPTNGSGTKGDTYKVLGINDQGDPYYIGPDNIEIAGNADMFVIANQDYRGHKGDNRRGEVDLDLIKSLILKSTSVVNWYPHGYESTKNMGATVRGPYGRWLYVTEKQGDDPEHIASAEDDAKYAAAAMNYLPHLVEEVETLREELQKMKDYYE